MILGEKRNRPATGEREKPGEPRAKHEQSANEVQQLLPPSGSGFGASEYGSPQYEERETGAGF